MWHVANLLSNKIRGRVTDFDAKSNYIAVDDSGSSRLNHTIKLDLNTTSECQ